MTLAFTRWSVRRLGLNIKKPKDTELLQFWTLTFSNIFERVAGAVRDDRGLDRGDWYWIADKVIKARKAYTFWAGPSAAQVTEAARLLIRICELLVKAYR